MAWLDSIVFFLNDYTQYIQYEIHARGWFEWVFFFFPFVVFGEMPRYLLPALLVPLLKLFRIPPDDTAAKRKFLETHPKVSVVVAGRNEEKVIGGTIQSLLELNYDNLEIIVVDDNSTDRMYEVAKPYADRGLIRLFRNTATAGRGGRPSATNFGLRMATGDIVISVDADTSYDRSTVLNMVGPFYDRTVGVVAGNLKVRNLGESVWANLQAAEYMISIGLWKRWTSILGTTMQASGAFGAFRREAIADVGGWDSELAEDADISLKIRKLRWRIVFAPLAIAMTTVPPLFRSLVRQRIRWDRGTVRTYYHKHGNLMDFRRFPISNFFELSVEYVMTVVATVVYAVYLIFMLWYNLRLLTFVLLVSYCFYVVTAALSLFTAVLLSERRRHEWWLLGYSLIFPFYKSCFRWIRLYAIILETLRVRYRDSYLPESAWDNTPKW